ncbi:Glyoxalase-like domain protein [Labrenzia sp. THAF35]|uniref:VOC family protein n=1 Tax=Labrenzia sp. THAF35 TaxID=2587854 RepID=UPI001268E062|nr:VOC family protein [Labrenzia sp. THAF35]QFT66720.1 Glyoxalase-like domain protein [Labrenzia sp. THAF35]
MTVVKRIIANIAADSVPKVREFYAELFSLDVLMDLGWIVTLGTADKATTQLSILREGGSGAPVPHLSIEVSDVDEVYARAREMNCTIVPDSRNEPWGVRRFFVTDPTSKIVNVLSHIRS